MVRTLARALMSALAIVGFGGCASTQTDSVAATFPVPCAEPMECNGTAGAPASSATIDWDQWGVPHIDAESREGAFYALGWAQARGRPDLLLEMMGQGRGRAAELWGEDYFQSDELMWRMGVPQALDVLYEAQGPEYQRNLDAFAAGINEYFAGNPDAGSQERRRVLPVSARDAIGHGQRALNLTFMAGEELQGLQRRLAGQETAAMETAAGERGSNGWAIAPSRSASGDAMLLINPHLPWDGLFTWFETHITTPEINAYGATLIGQPAISVGFNERLGWTHTVNVLDATDVYALAVEGAGYRFGGELLPFEVEQATVRVRGANGAMEERTLTLTNSVHGPILGRRGDIAYAIRVAGLADPDHSRTIEQYWDMVAADNRAAFEAAFSRLQNPMFNMVYADADGEIAYVSNGLHPVRARGDAAFWRDVVDGSDPALLWTDYHPYSALMRVANPPSGFVQNSNEPGWTSAIPPAIDPANFPADFPPPFMRSRPQHGIEMLLGDESISFEELGAYARDTRLALADNVLDELVAAARADGSEAAVRAADVLAAWDRRTELGSRGAALFMLWTSAYQQSGVEGFYARQWDFSAPAEWPDGLGNDGLAVAALVATVAQMEGAGIPIDVPWGNVARIPDDGGHGATLPVTLGPGEIGAFFVGYFSPSGEGRAFDFSGGTSFVSTVEFGAQVRARALLPYGNFAERPEGVQNQLELLCESRFRDVNFTTEAVAESSVMREELALPVPGAR